MTSRLIGLVLCLGFMVVGCSSEPATTTRTQRDEPSATLRVNIDNIGRALDINRELAQEFERETGIAVQFVVGPDSSTERLAEYQRFLQARSSDIDVYQLDVIWPGIFAPHLEDLSETINLEEHFPAATSTWMVGDRLVAAPYYADAPLLYYRSDLLAENGFAEPPKTWDEMADMAATIQRAERAKGNSSFYGFVFQGAAYEGLTCNAMEWQVAETGVPFLTEEGSVSLTTPEAISLFTKMATRIKEICPPGVLTYKEDEARLIFNQGNAAFMRNWPFAYSLAMRADSPINGRFDVAILPSGASQSAATLGGWGLGVSIYSTNKNEAKQFVAFMSSQEAQRRRAIEGGYLATRPDVFADEAVNEAMPYFPMMKDVLATTIIRPAGVAGRNYNEISSAYYTAVHRILTGDMTAEQGLSDAEARIKRIIAR